MYHFSLWSARDGLPVQCVVSPLSYGFSLCSLAASHLQGVHLWWTRVVIKVIMFLKLLLEYWYIMLYIFEIYKLCKDTFNITIWLYCYKTALFCFVLYGSSVALIIVISLKYEIRLDNMWYIDVIKDRGCRTKIKYLFSKGL